MTIWIVSDPSDGLMHFELEVDDDGNALDENDEDVYNIINQALASNQYIKFSINDIYIGE